MPLQTLSTELLFHIVEDLGLKDVLSLVLTSKRFWWALQEKMYDKAVALDEEEGQGAPICLVLAALRD
ncbi:hypothetical protein AJ79_02647 [Helicocarpus griseus UAMH5409]|uniref:Uncharacterized protein n=1 Tax=Helicocarpus griseus UAMH5409 TaxID=1447875 RepID=A0A2B7Y247_9EURO|nr:hypothetical protein AJ79_02647 [Helicocarpus griseus UAMH5409]